MRKLRLTLFEGFSIQDQWHESRSGKPKLEIRLELKGFGLSGGLFVASDPPSFAQTPLWVLNGSHGA